MRGHQKCIQLKQLLNLLKKVVPHIRIDWTENKGAEEHGLDGHYRCISPFVRQHVNEAGGR